MKHLIKISIGSALIALFILHPNCVNQKQDCSQLNMQQNRIPDCTQALPAAAFNYSQFNNESKEEMSISAELIVLNNHSRPKKRRPIYLYC